MADATEKLKIEVSVKDLASKQFSALGGVVSKFGGGALSAFKSIGNAVFSLKGALAGLGVALTVKGITDLVNATADEADELRDLSKQLGTSTEFLSEFKFAAGQAGVEISEVEVGLRTLRKNLGEIAVTGKGEAQEALNLLSRSFNNLVDDGASLEEIVKGLAKELQKLPEQERVFAASKLFGGRQGATFLQIFADDLDAATAKARELGTTISGKAADDADAFNDAIGELKGSLVGLRNQAILPLLPELKKLIQEITRFIVEEKPRILGFFADFVEGAGEAAQSVKNLADAVRDPGGAFVDFFTEVGLTIGGDTEKLKEFTANQQKSSRAIADGAKDAAKAIRDLANAKNEAAISDEELLRRIADNGELTDAYKDQKTSIDGLVGSATRLNSVRAQASTEPLVPLFPSTDVDEVRKDQLALNEAIFDEAKARAAVGEEIKKRQQSLREQQNAAAGASAAFKTLTADSKKFGEAANEAILNIAGSLSNNLTEGIIDLTDGVGSAREAFSKLAKSAVADIQRIIIQTLILKAIQAGVGGIGGLLAPTPTGGAAKGGVFPGTFQPISGSMAGGGVVRSRGLFELAEGQNAEAVVPLPDNRSVPVKFVGGSPGAQGGGDIYVTVNYNGTIGEKALFARNAEQIRQAVAQGVRSSPNYREQIRTAA